MPFDPDAYLVSSGEEFDPDAYLSDFNPDEYLSTAEEKPKKNKTDAWSYLQDAVRFVSSPFVAGGQAIAGGVEAGFEGGDVIEGMVQGVGRRDLPFGASMEMETGVGKTAEEYMGKALDYIHKNAGEQGVDLFKSDIKRNLLKGSPFLAPIASFYEQLPEDSQLNFEELVRTGATITPDVLMMIGGGKALGKREAKPKAKTLEELRAEEMANKEAPVYTTEPADMFPETQKTPYGTKTGEPTTGWTVDENGIPVNRSRTENLQRTESASFEQEFKTPEFVGEREAARTDPTKLNPQELPLVDSIEGRAKQPDLFFDEAAQKLDVASNQGELFGTTPLGQMGFGKGQRGSIGWKKEPKSLEEQAKSLPKDQWLAAYEKKYPGEGEIGARLYDKLATQKPSFGIRGFVPPAKKTVEALDYGLGIVSTRIGNLHPRLKQRSVDFEYNNLKSTWDRFQSSEKFMKVINQFSMEDKTAIDMALMHGNYDFLKKSFPVGLKPEVGKVQKVLSDIDVDLRRYGITEHSITNYFPRGVKDLDGLYKKMGVEKASALQREIAEKSKYSPLSEVELADITNKYLTRPTARSGPGFSKGRVLKEIPEDYLPYFHEPTKMLDMYIRSATFQIEKAKFFGKSAVKDSSGRMDLSGSIGNYVIDLLNKGELRPDQVVEFSELLKSRFGGAQQASGAIMQGAKDVVHVGLLGDFSNALIQNADIATAFAFDGIRPTLTAVLAKIKGADKVTAKDFGLLNHIADDFISDRFTTKAVTKTFKLSGLSKIDAVTKDLVMNASLLSAKKAAQTGDKGHYLFYEYQKRFGEEFPQLLEDLKSGKKTDLTDRFAFSELANRQPISKLEYSQFYMDRPNVGRGALILKSFMLKQADLYRNRVYNQMKENPRVAVANAARLSIALASLNTGWEYIRDYLAGKPMKEFDETTLPANLFKIFGYNEYFSDKIQREAFGEAAGDLVLPPYKAFDPLFKDIGAALDDDRKTKVTGKWKTFVPVIGDEWYWRSEEGQKEKRRRESDMRSRARKEERE